MRRLVLATLLAVASGAALGAFLPGGSARAGTAVRSSLDDLFARCDLALEATVVRARCLLGPAGRPETEVELDVHRTFRGEDLPARSIRLPGGVLQDGSGMLVPGLPILQPGERAVLFLTEPGSSGARMIVGLAQGHLRVLCGPNGTKWAVCDLADLSLLDGASGGLAPAGAAAVPYAELLAVLEAAAVRRRAREERGG